MSGEKDPSKSSTDTDPSVDPSKTSPDVDPSKGPDTDKDVYHIEGAPDALQLENIDELRKKQQEREDELLAGAGINREARENARKKARSEFDGMINEYLLAKGIVPGPKFDEYAALLRGYSVDNIPEEKWAMDWTDDSGTIQASLRQGAYQDIKDNHVVAPTDDGKDKDPTDTGDKDKDDPDGKGKDDEPPVDDPDKDKGKGDDEPEDKDKDDPEKKKKEEHEARLAEIERLEKELDGLQEAKHTAFAARMAVSYFKKGKRKELDEAYIEAEKAYLEKLRELELLRITDRLSEIKDEKTARSTLAKDLEDRFSDRLKEDHKKQKEAMLEEGGFKAKLMEKYQSLTPKQKIMFAVGLGAVMAAGGFGITVMAGVAGSVIAVVGAGGMAAARGVKTYATMYSRVYRDKAEEDLNFKVHFPEAHKTPADMLDVALARLSDESRRDIESGDKAKRNAVLIGMGTAALGSVAGHALGHGLDWVTDRPSGWLGGVTGDVIAGPEAAPTPPVDQAHSWVVENTPPAPKPMEFPPEARIMSPGEGGYKAIRDAFGGNITTQQMHDLWADPKLMQELGAIDNGFGRPLVYQMENGQYGFRMTADGQMPQKALEAMANRYHEMFGANPAIPGGEAAAELAPKGPDNPLPATIDHPVVTAQDVNSLQEVVSKPKIEVMDIISHQSVFDKFNYVPQGMNGENFAMSMGMPVAVWRDSLVPYIEEQLRNSAVGYTDVFYDLPNGGVAMNAGKIPNSLMADLLNHVPAGVRDTLAVR